MYLTKEKIKAIKKMFFWFINTKEIKKMLKGEPYKKNNGYYKLLKKSQLYCEKYNELCTIPNYLLTKKQAKKKTKLLDKLFLGHGTIFGVGENISTVIGMVDLGDNIYINYNVKFSQDTLVTIGDYFICAPNVVIGSGEGKVCIDNDVWVCANVKIDSDVHIGKGCVISACSLVPKYSLLSDCSLYEGEKLEKRYEIKPNFKSQKNTKDNEQKKPVIDDDSFNYIVSHIKSLGICGNFSEYKNFLYGKPYNSLDRVMSKINDLSHALCAQYDQNTNENEKELIIDKLFPIKGKGCTFGNKIFLDTIGGVRLGNDVKIGNNVTLLGNIVLSDNCEIKDGVSLLAIGHKMHYMDRHIRVNENGNLVETNTTIPLAVPNGEIVEHNIISRKKTKIKEHL